MNVPVRLVSFAVGLVLVFGASYVVAGAVVPDRVVEDWTRSAAQSEQHDDPAAPHSGQERSGSESSGRELRVGELRSGNHVVHDHSDLRRRRHRIARPSRRCTMSAPADTSANSIELEIDGMTCAACAMRIEKRLNKLDGVEATVNYATEKARVLTDGAIDADELIAAVEATGYHASLPRPRADERGVDRGGPARTAPSATGPVRAATTTIRSSCRCASG